MDIRRGRRVETKGKQSTLPEYGPQVLYFEVIHTQLYFELHLAFLKINILLFLEKARPNHVFFEKYLFTDYQYVASFVSERNRLYRIQEMSRRSDFDGIKDINAFSARASSFSGRLLTRRISLERRSLMSSGNTSTRPSAPTGAEESSS